MITTIVLAISAVIVGLISYEQLILHRKGGILPGPMWTIPWFGELFEMIYNPHQLYEKWAKRGTMSWSNVAGMFFVYVTDPKLIQSIFKAPGSQMRVILHPNANAILGDGNIAFLHDAEHANLRKRLVPLFSRNALRIYLGIQERLIRETLKSFVNRTDPFPVRWDLRDLNVKTSLTVFVGPYLTDIEGFSKDYLALNEGFLALPINFPGTTLWKAVQARKRIVQRLTLMARKRNTDNPTCLIDFIEGFTDEEIGNTMLDILFASQDASTSSLIWAVALLAERKDDLIAIRKEQERLRPNDEALTHELLNNMEITRKFVNNLLRYRPAATAVPHRAVTDYELGGYTVPKDAILFPSIWHAHDTEKFESDDKTFLTFGFGKHHCLGSEYATNHLIAFVALLSKYDFRRHVIPGGDEILYTPTVIPKDGVVVSFYRPT